TLGDLTGTLTRDMRVPCFVSSQYGIPAAIRITFNPERAQELILLRGVSQKLRRKLHVCERSYSKNIIHL
ncbi:MAG: hypothetical protein ACI4TC_04330, partial [Kiritimatiellia bacterium]